MYLGKIESGKSYKKFYIFFILLSLGVLGGIVYVSFSRATITISPSRIEFETNFETTILENPENEESIPGKVLSIEIEESRQVKTHDTKGFEAKAQGTVTISNKREKDQPLLAKTRLMSASGILFRTDKRVVVPAGEKVEVTVTAAEEGKQGNIEPEHFTIVNIWKAWQDQIYAESDSPMTGGYTELPYVYEHTILQSFDLLAEELYEKGLITLGQNTTNQEKILETAIKHEMLEFSASVEPETQTDKFNIKVKTRSIVLIFNEERLKALAEKNLKQEAPKDKELLGPLWEEFTYRVKSYDLENKTALLEAGLRGESRSKISADLFKKKELIGLDRYEIKKYFEQFEDIGTAEVYFKPFWVRKVPAMVDHFEIEIK